MSQDSIDRSASAPAETDASKTLSAHVFSNPAEFLQVLQTDLKNSPQQDHGLIYLSDLIAYSDHGTDPKGRAAAKIAAEHYSELQPMAARASQVQAAPGISDGELKVDIQLMEGNYGPTLHSIQEGNAFTLLDDIMVTGAAAFGAVALLDIPPVAAVSGGVAVAGVGGAISLGKSIYQAPAVMKTEMKQDQKMIGGWL
jgi:hypothetical protein